MDFDLLPQEIKSIILNYLTDREICCKVIPVCKQWRSLATSAYGRKRLQFESQDTLLQTFMHQLNTHKGVVSLKVTAVRKWNWVTKSPVINSIRKLEFYDCTFIGNTITQLCCRFPYVEELVLHECKLPYDIFGAQASEWILLKTLTINNVRRPFYSICNCDWTPIANKCTNLTDFRVWYPISAQFLTPLLTIRGQYLRKLDIHSFDVNAFQLLKLCTHLTHLRIVNYGLWNFDVKLLLPLRQLNQLQSLVLYYCGMTESPHFRILFQNWQLPKLFELKLVECYGIQEKGAISIAKGCPNLKKLCFSSTDITNDGVRAIFENCKYLEEAHLMPIHSDVQKVYLEQINKEFPNILCSKNCSHVRYQMMTLK